ncbi:GNAT family N-acetyltransferase [Sinorhizobium meliloti]|nr:GNAT family N-acetyltransferase [Sinorhizobium meliloti]RMI18599.1 GNAT family N-acetyltransferase [Sinorhizobium meliloti]RVH94448.1 GNAT family N-acetyltransferase [Sinorhizobium meliloti]RVK31890.1 GNAT family N-acetyltransferase [Sinorhizobium meliloti]RVK88237.1 GNAT family N-acetyltransferase [Sinorhizobium meliloti]
MELCNLTALPTCADIIAVRAWNAWWTESGVSLAEYRAHLDPMMEGEGIPLALVAHEQGMRRRGIAAKLMDAARKEASARGHAFCYLCATPDNSPYYLARGFKQIESEVSGLNLFSTSC